MKLKKVEIHGFRSIEEMEIEFEGCGHKVLVGKNESGKSNILKALNLLSGTEFARKDKKEMYDKQAYVRFFFSLNSNEIEQVQENFYQLFPAGVKDRLTEKLTIEDFFKEHSTYILYQTECGEVGHWTYRELENAEIFGQWYQITGEIPPEIELFPKANINSFVNRDYLSQFSKEDQDAIKHLLSEVTIEKIYQSLRKIIKEVAAPAKYIFPVINWKYSAQENDLPDHVNIIEFINNLRISDPLISMFLLAGIKEKDIGTEISNARASFGINKINNLFNDVNKKTNGYIKNNWKEYEEVEIELRRDGGNIVIAIKETNSFDFSERSDGFRRLVSFLLMMNLEDKKDSIDKKLILIDEPEVGLHPSSAKDLRNKLIKLGANNLVVYATHSISMIDTDNIKNNLVVSRSRRSENTEFEEVKEDGTSPAEIVYRAIGFSIYEDLKKNNILLEGYTDKKILKSFMTGTDWKDFGICYTDGVNNIRNVSRILELADRKYFILSDADDAAKKAKKEFIPPDSDGPAKKTKKEMENFQDWFTYKDLGCNAITIEDFYEQEFFSKIVKEVFQKYKISLPKKILDTNRMILIQKDIPKEKKNEIKSAIKTKCIEKLEKNDVVMEKMENMLGTLLKKIKPEKKSMTTMEK